MIEIVGIIAGLVAIVLAITLYRARESNIDPINNCEIVAKLKLGQGRKFVIIEHAGQKFAIVYNSKDSQLVHIK